MSEILSWFVGWLSERLGILYLLDYICTITYAHCITTYKCFVSKRDCWRGIITPLRDGTWVRVMHILNNRWGTYNQTLSVSLVYLYHMFWVEMFLRLLAFCSLIFFKTSISCSYCCSGIWRSCMWVGGNYEIHKIWWYELYGL